MPNAKDIPRSPVFRVFPLAYTGGGKTTNFLTFPGKKFAYIFDPNGELTLRGHDVDYEIFAPDVRTFNIQSLKKAVGDVPRVIGPSQGQGSTVYLQWEEHFE